MRWVLTWTPSDLSQVTDLKVSSPTLSRLGEMLALQWAAFNHAEWEYAHATPAFLQCDGQDMQDSDQDYARARDEIACANESTTRLSCRSCEGGAWTWQCATKLVPFSWWIQKTDKKHEQIQQFGVSQQMYLERRTICKM